MLLVLKGNNLSTPKSIIRRLSGRKSMTVFALAGIVTITGAYILGRPGGVQNNEVPIIVSNTLITPALITDQTLSVITTNQKIAVKNTTRSSESKGRDCLVTPVNQDRLISSDQIIAKLASGAETACGGQVFSGAMRFFSPNPTEVADWQADAIKETSRLGMRSVIVLETGSMNFNDIAAGQYDQQLIDYFKNLSERVSADQLGTVVVCGEPIVGERPGANADNFIECINRFAGAARASFPDIALSTIVDEAEFETLSSALPKLRATGIASVGLQAFSNGDIIKFNGGKPDIDFYFSSSRIKAAMNKIDAPSYWLNTGVTTADKGQNITYSNEQRQQVAAELAKRINQIGSLDFVNLFIENKLTLSEGRDFSVSPAEPEWLKVFLSTLDPGYKIYGFDS